MVDRIDRINPWYHAFIFFLSKNESIPFLSGSLGVSLITLIPSCKKRRITLSDISTSSTSPTSIAFPPSQVLPVNT